jgi:hypothetical protein
VIQVSSNTTNPNPSSNPGSMFSRRTAALLILAAAAGAAVLVALSGPKSAAAAGTPVVPPGVILLNRTNLSGQLTISGNALVQTSQLIVNSSSNGAITGSGNARIQCQTLRLVGTSNFSGNAGVTGTVVRLTAPVPNPLSHIVIPAAAGSGADVTVSSGTTTLNPGTYKAISVSNQGTLVMNPGVYNITSGMSVSGGRVTGNGVTLVFSGGSMNLSGPTVMSLTPPTSGSLAGYSMVQPLSNNTKMSLSGGSDVSIAGTIYAPSAEATLSGSADLAVMGPLFGETVVIDRMTISGDGQLRMGIPITRSVTPPVLAPQAD